jgi:hypothetical protein
MCHKPLLNVTTYKATQMDDYASISRKLDLYSAPHDDTNYPKQYCDPSRYWGERLGIPELYCSYEEVLGDKHASMQEGLLNLGPKASASLTSRLYVRLCDYYPEIADIELSHSLSMWHVVFGCISKFTPSDIDFFVNDGRTRSLEEENRRLRISEVLGYHLEWRLSPTSCDLMDSKLGIPVWKDATFAGVFNPKV